MKDKNIFNWIISVLAIILVVVSAYFGFTQKGLNSGTSANRWSSQNGVSEIKRHGYIRVAVQSAPIKSASQLKNKKLIVTKGTTAENYFTKQGNVNLLKFDSKTQQFNALKNGRGAVLADDNSYLYVWVKQNPKYTVGIKSIGPKQYISPAVKKGNRSLLRWANREITKLNKESFFVEDYNKELRQYFGKDIKPTDIILKQSK